MKNTIKKALGLTLALLFTVNFSQIALAEDYSEETTITSQSEEETTTTTKEEDNKNEGNLASLNVGSFKSYMDYRAITSVGSAQYELQQFATTGQYGIRTVNGRYLVAVSSTFGEVGDNIDITLEGGQVLPCTIGDIKAYTNLLGGDGSLVEFIVDTDSIPSEVSKMGTFGVIFEGNVVSVN